MDWYHMTRDEKHREMWRRNHLIMKDEKMNKIFTQNSDYLANHFQFCWSFMFPGTSILHLHQTMFTRCILMFANDE